MQKKSHIPTPLIPEAQSRKVITIVEPTLPGRLRFFRMLIFIYGLILRSLIAKVFPIINRNFGPKQQAQRMRLFMEKMGGLWVKAGQIVALRRDIFNEEFCAELAKLQDRAHGFPLHYARTVIESELGKPLSEIFAEFPEQPLAAASIGQTYRARLRSPDVEVVVKVRRPTIENAFKVDLRYLYLYAWFLSKIGFAPNFRWLEMYWELENAILEELDYRQEAASLRRMRKNLRSHKIYVPRVFLDFCSDRVLVMEMVQGVYMSDFIRVSKTNPERVREWLRENKIDAFQCGRRLLFSHYRQLFEDNLYHCDLHPGNILLMRKNRITLIDFGSVGSTDKTQLTRYMHTYKALAARDYKKFADLYLLLPPSLPNKDLTEVKEQIVRLFREFEQRVKIKSMPYHEKSVGAVSGDLAKIIGDAGISAAWEFLRSARAQLTLDASLMFLMPRVNYLKTIQKYMEGMRDRMAKKAASSKLIRAQLARLSDSADVPTKLAENAYFEGEYLRRRAIKYEGYLSKASKIGRYVYLAMSRGMLATSALAVLVAIQQRWNLVYRLRGTWVYDQVQRLPRLDTIVWIIISIAALYISRECVVIGNILSQASPNRAGGDRR